MEEHRNNDKPGALLPSSQSLRRLAISESGFVFDPMSGHHFTVNETGLEILRHLQKDRDMQELLALLAQEYSVGTRELERDVLEFAGMLRKFVGD
jgi:PqqD family protein of HPr-rel-A system